MNYKINHIGYLTNDIAKTAEQFEYLGFSVVGGVICDSTQKTRLCFLHKEGETDIELVEPFVENEPMLKMLKKRGVSPYHICYEVDDVEKVFDELHEKEWLPLFTPVPAPAFDNRLICYMFKPEIGYVEFVNKQ